MSVTALTTLMRFRSRDYIFPKNKTQTDYVYKMRLIISIKVGISIIFLRKPIQTWRIQTKTLLYWISKLM